MVLRGKRPPFLDIIADGDAETMTFVDLLRSSEMVSHIHSTTF
jgi:hypothetical protein